MYLKQPNMAAILTAGRPRRRARAGDRVGGRAQRNELRGRGHLGRRRRRGKRALVAVRQASPERDGSINKLFFLQRGLQTVLQFSLVECANDNIAASTFHMIAPRNALYQDQKVYMPVIDFSPLGNIYSNSLATI